MLAPNSASSLVNIKLHGAPHGCAGLICAEPSTKTTSWSAWPCSNGTSTFSAATAKRRDEFHSRLVRMLAEPVK